MTTPDTSGDVAVVKPYYLLEEAYRMGNNEFSDVTADEDEAEPIDLSPFKSSARWANHVAPDLRAMAGYADAGHGTYQQHRQIAAIHDGCEEDEPAEADLCEATDLYEALVEAWDTGAYDGAVGDYDPDSVQYYF